MRFLCDFINTVSGQGECEMFIIHARKAWLSGLSPKENREIPPLDYPRVYQLKRDFPHLTMSINGRHQIAGRGEGAPAPYGWRHGWPRSLSESGYTGRGGSGRFLAPIPPMPTRLRWFARCIPILSVNWSQGAYLGHITRHMLGLFQGIPGARQWRRYLSENAHKAGADVAVLEQALKLVADKR
ncbi:tRNA dihydrouridine synthase A [Salmonella enterica subsp. enterica]|uniref:tRNA dihydrouridine synthase A n=1 Tax=Salmonella enterica I TaxID=59201 RepID=A0A447TPZ5_SALET|nr:tRNA dihydrouridine synthase A [Salmonella enterica subsp. enterica]